MTGLGEAGMILWCDFETRSECDLKVKGVYNYARDATTQVLCMAWALDDGDVTVWTPGQPVPDFSQVTQVRAHNAAFERLIWAHVLAPDHGIPVPAPFYCTATQARANCAPGSLEDVGRFAGADMKKDYRGAQLVRKCCIPPFKHTEQDLADLYAYCAQDVRAMRAVSKAMRELTDEELADYWVNERINDRGVLVDVDLCQSAIKYASDEMQDIERTVVEVTEGAITSVRSPKMRQWVLERVGPEAKKIMRTFKDGKEKYSIDKSVRANLLALAEENPDEIPPAVAEVIQCADDLWSSSVAKFSRLAALADEEDHRVRGAFVFAGGSATGRVSSYGAQVHNLPSKSAKDPQSVRTAMVRGHALVPRYGETVNAVLKSMLRPAIVAAPGHVLIAYDWSAIEGRVHPWLSNCQSGEDKLDVFRSGRDPYIVNAAATFRMTYEDVLAEHQAGNSEKRQIGKVQELALGFLGGPGAFETFGRIYGVRLSEAEVKRAVDGWRRANPWAMQHGRQLEQAYRRAMRNPGHEIRAGRIIYLFDGQMLWYALPSGRVLCYPFARFDEDGGVSYSKASWKPAADATEWPRARLWPGLAAENVVQATAHDLLRVACRWLDQEGIAVVLTVHDEIGVECKVEDAEQVAKRVHEIMCTPPDWAPGLPLAAEGTTTTRYS